MAYKGELTEAKQSKSYFVELNIHEHFPKTIFCSSPLSMQVRKTNEND